MNILEYIDRTGWKHDVNPGWQPIVEDAIRSIAALNPATDVLQVKEKFGGLRIYLDRQSIEMDSIINAAERRARQTCEYTGSTVDVTTAPIGDGYWTHTACAAYRNSSQSNQTTQPTEGAD